jgi:type I restriction enzyme S subunit
VTEIEKQFSRLEEGVAALKRVQANLKRYRAAVLKAACEGRLVPTEAELALASGKTFETGEQLLTRILAERRQKWQGRGKYKEPAVPDTSRQPKLPDGWTWARIGQLFECIVPNRDKPRTFTGEIPWITLPDFSEATTIGTGSRKIGLSKAEVEEYNARVIPSGSVVMSCIGRFGLAAKIAQDSVINQQLHAFVIPPFLPAEYFVYALRAGKTYMESIATSTTIAYLNKDNCNRVPIPLPPLAEQTRIVAEVERRLSVVEELEATVSANLQRATRLRQSILQKAFTGELA